MRRVHIGHALLFIVMAMAVAGRAVATPQTAMTFTSSESEAERAARVILHDGRIRIYASGAITPGTSTRLRAFVAQRGIRATVVTFDSLGGSLEEGIRLGETIRELGFDTDVGTRAADLTGPPSAVCASACSYAYAGGVGRFVSDLSGRLGVHQFSGPATAGQNGLDLSQEASGYIVTYLQRMGVDSEAFAIATRAGSDDVIWLTEVDALRIHLANNGVSAPIAEVRLVDGHPYLRVEQQRQGAMARVIFLCGTTGVVVMGGIVTDPDSSREALDTHGISYLELDDLQIERQADSDGARAEDSVVWVERALSGSLVRRIQASSRLGIWLENGSPMRYGTWLDLTPAVKERIAYYLANCRPTN